MLGFESLFMVIMALLTFGPSYLGNPQQVISDLDTSINATNATSRAHTPATKEDLEALLNRTLTDIAKLNQTMVQQGIDDGMVITQGFVLDPTDNVVGGIAGAKDFDKPQVINQTSDTLIINQSD
jgi:activator of 2-hydroxyglutaryl-CoA dehydratase